MIEVFNTHCIAIYLQQSGAEEACWAHNPEVGGSKPPSATYNLYAAGLNGACPGVEPGTSRTRSANHTTRPTGQLMSFSCMISDLHPPIAQLAERRTVEGTMSVILRSLVQIRLGGDFPVTTAK